MINKQGFLNTLIIELRNRNKCNYALLSRYLYRYYRIKIDEDVFNNRVKDLWKI